MLLKRASLREMLRYGAAFGALSFAVGAASAQTPDQQTVATTPATQETPTGGSRDTVVITGSLIARSPENAAAPLIQIRQDEIVLSGEPNIVDFLADIPALSGSTVPEDTTGSNLNDGGLSLLNLRDLGAARTLVLVNGRRHVGAPQGSLSVDVDTIPTMLIESVEIVTGGQSAIYGADAVSGVVNFLLKDNFDGLQFDGALAEINQSGQLNRRLSMLAGKNFLDDRANVYLSAEWTKGDEVKDSDVDWRREGWILLNNDTDPTSAQDDGQLDNILLRNARDAFFARGGLVLLSGVPRPSATNDPDIPPTACPTTASTMTTAFSNSAATCFNVGVELGTAFVFDGPGQFRPFNFGSFQDQNGASRRVNVGGDGLNVGTEFSQGSRIPETEAQRYQGGFRFDINNYLTAFGEIKYVTEETYDEGQPTFFQGGIGSPVAGTRPTIFATSGFNVGLDNAYLPAGLRTAIQNNVRTVYGAPTATAPGAVTSTVADPRATFNMFGPNRSQLNVRNVERYVLGVRGGFDSLAFVNDVNWELGWTHGETTNKNREEAVDVTRFAFSADAIVDTAGVLGTPGAIVCRATLLSRQGFTVTDPFGAAIAPSNPTLTQCKPTNIFGVDLRDPTTAAASRDYWTAAIHVTHKNLQQNWKAFASGSLWDFWGAGPIGVAVGAETRREKTYGMGRNAQTAGRLLFLNTGPDFAPAGYSTEEVFGEVQLPLIRDSWLGRYAEVSAAYRFSDYTTVGEQEVSSFSAQYRPIDDVMLRLSYGTSIRVPNLSENFGPATQTFGNNLVDPCDFLNLSNFTQTDATRGANRRANCVALLGGQYNPDTTEIRYPSGVPGVNSGNPFLQPEEGRSYTGSIVLTPRFWPDASLVIDYYDIKITNVIAAVTVQQALNQCVNDTSLNTAACATITRNGFIGAGDPNNFRVNSFIQGSLNYAATLAKGIDFAAQAGFDLQELIGRNWGDLQFRLRGNYLIRQQDFVNITNPSAATNWDSTVGLPRVRFLLTTAWMPTDDVMLSWDVDWQAEQEILDDSVFVLNPDNRLREYANTTPFIQNDLTLRIRVNDQFTFRGGVVNVFDQEPDKWLGSSTTADNFDLFGRRFFVGFNYAF